MTAPSWYDVLGLAPDASNEEVRAAWRAGIVDLDPSDRRFRSLNAAAEVLLDPARRAAHDAELAVADERSSVAESSASEGPRLHAEMAPVEVPAAGQTAGEANLATNSASPVPAEGRGRAVVRALGDLRTVLVLGVVALVMALVTAVVVLGPSSESGAAGSGLPSSSDVAAARAAAEAAIGPVLSYDYRRLDEDRAAALTYLTPDQAERYGAFFDGVVAENAVSTETVVSVRLVASGIVRTGPGRVDVLLFINRPTANKQRSVEYHDQVTAQMRAVDGEWLIDCLITQPGRGCSDS